MAVRFLPLIVLVLALAGCTASQPAAPAASTPAAETAATETPTEEAPPVSVAPERPQAGQPVTVTYRPQADGARLETPETVELVYRSEEPDYRIAPMQKEGAGWTVQITPRASARFLRFYVQSDSVKDQNGGSDSSIGWGRLLHDASGQLVRGAHVARADFYREQHEGTPGRDSLMRAEYRRELARYPDHLVARAHLRALQAKQDTARADSLRGEALEEIDAARASDDPQTLREVQRAYYALGRQDEAQAVGARLAEIAPRGPEAAFAAFRRATADGISAARARRRADAFVERFPQSFFRSGIYEALFKKYRAAGETEQMLRAGRKWIRTEEVNRARAHRAVAQALAGAGRYDAALAHARGAVEAAGGAPPGYTLFKTKGSWGWAPPPRTPKERREHARRQRGRQRALLGRIHYRNRDYAQAAEVLAQAAEEHPADAETWAHLAQAYEKTGQADRAYAAAEEALRRQPSLRPARSLFRRLYAERHGSEDGLDAAIRAAVARLARGKLLGERLNQETPALRFTALNGDSLRTRALAGKVLVLDFWASWCGPCHAAFPHLQTTYDKYRDAPDVKFLVVNTSWNDSKARALQFIEENGYTFPVYWDAGGQVARALGVRSLPTTILIGKGGKMQFREAGFGGAARYVENLSMRIDLLREL